MSEVKNLRRALRFWVDRADRFEANLPLDRQYMRARGVLNPSYALGRQVSRVFADNVEEPAE